MIAYQQNDHWVAEGDGPMRYILAEGDTRSQAVEGYTQCYGRQYAEQESMTHFALKATEDGKWQ